MLATGPGQPCIVCSCSDQRRCGTIWPSMTLRSMLQDGHVAQIPAGSGWGEAVPCAAVGEVKRHSFFTQFQRGLLLPREFFHLARNPASRTMRRADIPTGSFDVIFPVAEERERAGYREISRAANFGSASSSSSARIQGARQPAQAGDLIVNGDGPRVGLPVPGLAGLSRYGTTAPTMEP